MRLTATTAAAIALGMAGLGLVAASFAGFGATSLLVGMGVLVAGLVVFGLGILTRNAGPVTVEDR